MGLAGKFVFFNQMTDGGIDDFCQYGEIVDQIGDFYVMIKWHRAHGDACPHDAAAVIVPIEEMAVLPGEEHGWQIFATREQLDAYKEHVGARPFGEDESDDGAKVIALPQRTH
jgi:hypothetical protein